MMEAAHRVMVLFESAESQGKPTLEQVEAAIIGDYGHEIRDLEEVFSSNELINLESGGGDAVGQARKIFKLAEHYRLELIRVMKFASEQISGAHVAVKELTEEQAQLIARVEALEEKVEEAEKA